MNPVDWHNSRIALACGILSLAALAGCAAPFSTSYLSGSRRQEAAGDAATPTGPIDPILAATDPKAVARRKALGGEPASADHALAGVLEDLQAIGAIDPAAQQQLMADLKQAKPENYPVIVGQFQAALAYRQQLAEREARDQSQLAADDDAPAETQGTSARLVSHSGTADGRTTAAPTAAADDASVQDAVIVSSSDSTTGHDAITTAAAVPGGPDRAASSSDAQFGYTAGGRLARGIGRGHRRFGATPARRNPPRSPTSTITSARVCCSLWLATTRTPTGRSRAHRRRSRTTGRSNCSRWRPT